MAAALKLVEVSGQFPVSRARARPEAHLQFGIARTRSRCDPRDCYRNLRPTARVSAELPLALVEEIDQARANVSRGRYLQMVSNAAMTREQPHRSRSSFSRISSVL